AAPSAASRAPFPGSRWPTSASRCRTAPSSTSRGVLRGPASTGLVRRLPDTVLDGTGPQPQRVPAPNVDLIFHAWGNVGEPVGLLLFEFDDHLDAKVLERAGELLIEVEPVLGCRLVADAGQPPYWERMPESVGVVCVAATSSEFDAFCRS